MRDTILWCLDKNLSRESFNWREQVRPTMSSMHYGKAQLWGISETCVHLLRKSLPLWISQLTYIRVESYKLRRVRCYGDNHLDTVPQTPTLQFAPSVGCIKHQWYELKEIHLTLCYQWFAEVVWQIDMITLSLSMLFFLLQDIVCKPCVSLCSIIFRHTCPWWAFSDS